MMRPRIQHQPNDKRANIPGALNIVAPPPASSNALPGRSNWNRSQERGSIQFNGALLGTDQPNAQQTHRLTFLPGVEPRLGVFALALSLSLPGVRGGTAVIRRSTPTSLATAAEFAVVDEDPEPANFKRLRARNAAIVLLTRALASLAATVAASRGAESSSIKLIPLGCRSDVEADADDKREDN